MKQTTFILFVILLLAGVAAAQPQTVLVEAESFDWPGGWFTDQQFIDQMGSPYLLAHGFGTPVADAKTDIRLSKLAIYRVWVRTRDWVAQWNAQGAPGRFQVLIDGIPLEISSWYIKGCMRSMDAVAQ